MSREVIGEEIKKFEIKKIKKKLKENIHLGTAL